MLGDGLAPVACAWICHCALRIIEAHGVFECAFISWLRIDSRLKKHVFGVVLISVNFHLERVCFNVLFCSTNSQTIIT